MPGELRTDVEAPQLMRLAAVPTRSLCERLLQAKPDEMNELDVAGALRLTSLGYTTLKSALKSKMDYYGLQRVAPEFNSRKVQSLVKNCSTEVRKEMRHVIYIYSDFLTEKLLLRVISLISLESSGDRSVPAGRKRRRHVVQSLSDGDRSVPAGRKRRRSIVQSLSDNDSEGSFTLPQPSYRLPALDPIVRRSSSDRTTNSISRSRLTTPDRADEPSVISSFSELKTSLNQQELHDLKPPRNQTRESVDTLQADCQTSRASTSSLATKKQQQGGKQHSQFSEPYSRSVSASLFHSAQAAEHSAGIAAGAMPPLPPASSSGTFAGTSMSIEEVKLLRSAVWVNLSKVQKQVKAAEQKKNVLQGDILDLRRTMSSMEEEMMDYQMKHDKLEEQERSVKERQAALEQELSKIHVERNVLESQNQELLDTVLQHETSIETYEEELKSVQPDYEGLYKKLSVLTTLAERFLDTEEE